MKTKKQLEELINNNKDSITKIEVDLKQVADEIKSSSGENVLKVERKCKFWNAGYCKHKKACPFLHPENICIESKCADKICKKRHPRTCRNWKKGLCRFSDLCEFLHEEKEEMVSVNSEENKNTIKQDDTMIEKLNDSSDYIDYDNLDSDDDEIVENTKNVKTKFSCDQCEDTFHVKSGLTRHLKTVHVNACDQCDFVTTNTMHLKMHVKACHKKNLQNKVNETKKRKSTDEITSSSSGKKKKIVLFQKKLKWLNVECFD